MTPERATELRRRIQETFDQAQTDGLISGDDQDAASVVTGWVLMFESASGEDSRWLHRLFAEGMFPWHWRGLMHEGLR